MSHRPSRFKSDLNFAIEEKLREAGIEIPFPQRDLHIRSGVLRTERTDASRSDRKRTARRQIPEFAPRAERTQRTLRMLLREPMRADPAPSAKLWCNGNETRPTEQKKAMRRARSFFCRIRDAFGVFARETSAVLGSAWAFVVALSHHRRLGDDGPTFGFSDTWQLIINTGTTIVTFLMVFLIQNTQNRDAKAVHLKLDELIRALGPARNKLVDLEKLSDDELKKLETGIRKAPQKSGRREGRGRGTQETPLRRVTGSAVSSGRASPLRMKTFPLGQSRKISQ